MTHGLVQEVFDECSRTIRGQCRDQGDFRLTDEIVLVRLEPQDRLSNIDELGVLGNRQDISTSAEFQGFLEASVPSSQR